MKRINEFKGEYVFLSNFFNSSMEFRGVPYRNAESAYQSMKTDNIKERTSFSELTPMEAKKKGRKINLREDWEDIKLEIMYKVVKKKFSSNNFLKENLLLTEDAYLEEGNYWHDTFWGVCNRKGENHLGKILMKVREELKNEEEISNENKG